MSKWGQPREKGNLPLVRRGGNTPNGNRSYDNPGQKLPWTNPKCQRGLVKNPEVTGGPKKSSRGETAKKNKKAPHKDLRVKWSERYPGRSARRVEGQKKEIESVCDARRTRKNGGEGRDQTKTPS